MATVSKTLGFHHFRGGQLSHVVRFKKGEVKKQGKGLAFWFRPLNTQVAEVPMDDQELPVTFVAKSKEFQDVTVSGIVTYRVASPDVTVDRLNFAVNLETGTWDEDPRDKVDSLLTQLTQQYAWDWISQNDLDVILKSGVAELRSVVTEGLRTESAVSDLGLAVVSVRISAVRPRADVEKALMTPELERMNQDMDRAVAERRAEAARQDAAISKQEQDNRIALAEQKAQLIERESSNALAEITAQSQRVELSAMSEAKATEIRAKAEAGRIKEVGLAEADIEQAKMNVLQNVPQHVLYSQAIEAVAQRLTSIGALTIGQDVTNKLVNEIEQ